MLAGEVIDFLATQTGTTYSMVAIGNQILQSSFPEPETVLRHLPSISAEQQESVQLLDARNIQGLQGWWLIFEMKSISDSRFVLYRDYDSPNFSQADLDFIKVLVAESEQTRKQIELLVQDEENLKKYLYLRSHLQNICLIQAEGAICRILNMGDREFTAFDWSLKEIENHFSEESLFRIQRSFIINPKMAIHVSKEPGARDYALHFLEPDIQELITGLLGDKKLTISRGKEKPCKERYPPLVLLNPYRRGSPSRYLLEPVHSVFHSRPQRPPPGNFSDHRHERTGKRIKNR